MKNNEYVLSYVLHSLFQKKSGIETPQKPMAHSWDYEIDVHDFEEEKKKFDLAKETYDYDTKLEILKNWYERYASSSTLTSQKLTKNLHQLIRDTQRDIRKREEFYQLIARFHLAHQHKDIKQQIDTLQKIYHKIGTFIYRDIYRRKKWLATKQKLPSAFFPIKGGTPRMRAELCMHIARRLSKLYKENPELASQYKENPYEWEQHAKDWEAETSVCYQNRCRAMDHSSNPDKADFPPLGQDAFETGGLYSPEAFSQRIQDLQEKLAQEKNKDKEEPHIIENGTYNGMPSIFSQEMLDAMINKTTRD